MWRDDALLLDILDFSRRALEFSRGVDYKRFQEDALLHSAILHELLIIGEAANKTSEECREKFPDLPWKEMIGLRNILIHEYFRVDLSRIWKILQENIPALVKRLESIVPPPDTKS
jgi:uncharacterized protein with HEPN domain